MGWKVVPALLLAQALASGCNESTPQGAGEAKDLGLPRPDDLGMEAVDDLSVPRDLEASDLATPPDLRAGPPDLVSTDMAVWGPPYRYVWNKVYLPKQKVDYSIDLNGDGAPDNALADLVVALQQYGIEMQAHVDSAVNLGTDIKLVRLDTIDPLFLKDPAASVTLRTGLPTMNPDYSGRGVFAVDPMIPSATYQSMLSNRRFFAPPPPAVPFSTDIKLAFALFGRNLVRLDLHGTHVAFETGFDAQSGAPALVSGALRGSVKIGDFVPLVVAGIAGAFNDHVAQNGPKAAMILQSFDVGGCVNPNNSRAQVDRVVDECEVSSAMLFRMLLAPDVQIYDQGRYMPDPFNGNPDSFSIGIGFTAVRASFP